MKFISGIFLTLFITLQVFGQENSKKFKHEFELQLEAEYRYFTQEGKFKDQEQHFPSLGILPEYHLSWDKGDQTLNIVGFFRFDVDDKRTHGDVREFYYQIAKNNWEISAGLKKVYWGVAESNHLVDVINQTDQVESFDGEKKLGQPMLHYSYMTNNWGTFDLFYLPYFRKRNFSGKKGRLRFASLIEADDIGFEDDAEEWHQDFAFRWSHSFSIFDVGVSDFYGTNREPIFQIDQEGNFTPTYAIVNQVGADIQATTGSILWKFESIYRTSDLQDQFSLVGGLEYTFGNVFNSGTDIGLLGEYLYDDRDELALNALQNDAFFATRIALNNKQSTELLFGSIFDLEKESKIISVEASQRIGESWKAEVEGRFFTDIDKEELILSNFEDDSFLRVSVFKFF